jgi:hypothetical protein
MKVLFFSASTFLSVALLSATSVTAATGLQGITNTISAFPINTDGQYDSPSEWTDVTPAWFVSSASGATPTFAGDPNANSLLFAALGRDTPTSDPELYLMYDYLGRTNVPTTSGEFLGNVNFPFSVNGVSKDLTVTFNENSSISGANVSVNLNDGSGPQDPTSLGLEGALGFGVTPAIIVGALSPFATTTHELIELGVPLNIAPGFGDPSGPFPKDGSGGGTGYSPDPATWTSNITNNAGDPPASAGLFTIRPDGSTFIVPHQLTAPEPSALVLGGLGALGLWVITRKRRVST